MAEIDERWLDEYVASGLDQCGRWLAFEAWLAEHPEPTHYPDPDPED